MTIFFTSKKCGSQEVVDIDPQPLLEWEAADRAGSYELQLSGNDEFDTADLILNISDITDTDYKVQSALDYGKEHFWRVRGINSGALGEWSEPRSFVTIPALPAKVVLSSPEQSEGGVDLQPQLLWESADRATSYSMQLSEDSAFDSNIIFIEDLNDTNYQTDQDLEYLATYYWRTRATNSAGNGEWSDPGTFVTVAQTPDPLFPLPDAEFISIAPTISWTSAHSDVQFRVQKSTSTDFDSPQVDMLTDQSFIEVEGLESNTDYFWRARVETGETESAWSEPINFTTRPNPDEIDYTVAGQISFGNTSNPQQREISDLDYRLVGLPGDDNLSVEAFFDGEYESDWQVFYDNGEDENYYVEFDPDSDQFVFQAGKGFWVLSKEVLDIDYEISNLPINEKDSYTAELNTGWNIISNPFPNAISWDDVSSLNEITSDLFRYNQQFEIADSLQPLEGYYIFNDLENYRSSIEIPFTPLDRKQHNSKEVSSLRAKTESAASNVNITANFAAEASLSVELVYSVPTEQTGDFIRYFPSLEMSKRGMMLTDDAIKRGGILRGESTYDEAGSNYELQIKGNVGEMFTWTANLNGMSDQARVLIVNRVTNLSWLLEDGETVDSQLSEPISRYDVYVGDEARLTEKQESLIPDEITLLPNYPNPFNPTTNMRYSLPERQHVHLEVYDVIGRRVQVLQDGIQNSGWHNIQFDARSLASGVYFYRLQTEASVKIEKMTLIK